MRLPAHSLLVCAMVVSTAGCAGNVFVHPTPPAAVAAPIPMKVRIAVVEGVRGRGITLNGLQQGVIDYARKRGTFEAISESRDAALLTLTSALRFDGDTVFHYDFQLSAVLSAGGRTLGSYQGSGRGDGGMTRFSADSDDAPANAGLTAALNALFASIEADRPRLLDAAAPSSGVAADSSPETASPKPAAGKPWWQQ